MRGERVRTVPAWQRYAVNKLRQVLRIGGSPFSGKSSIAHVLPANRRFALYSCDDAFERHAAAITAMHGPTLKKVTTWSVAQRLAQPVEVQVADTLQLYREEFPLITVALRVPLVVEGAALLPELLAGATNTRRPWCPDCPGLGDPGRPLHAANLGAGTRARDA
jgi:hypothetical protein